MPEGKNGKALDRHAAHRYSRRPPSTVGDVTLSAGAGSSRVPCVRWQTNAILRI